MNFLTYELELGYKQTSIKKEMFMNTNFFK